MTRNATPATRKAAAALIGAERQAYMTSELLALAVKLGDEQHTDTLRREMAEWEYEVELCMEHCVELGMTPDDVYEPAS